MSQTVEGQLRALLLQRVAFIHQLLLRTTEDLSEEQFRWRPSPTAPPIGWHLWHMARWADRLQAVFPSERTPARAEPHPDRGIWQQEDLARTWGLEPAQLGLMETGAGMDPDHAAALAELGRDRLLGYARRTFAALDQVVSELSPKDMTLLRPGAQDYGIAEGELRRIPGRETTVADDLLFHVSHGGRHLGMIEALRGALGLRGTATV